MSWVKNTLIIWVIQYRIDPDISLISTYSNHHIHLIWVFFSQRRERNKEMKLLERNEAIFWQHYFGLVLLLYGSGGCSGEMRWNWGMWVWQTEWGGIASGNLVYIDCDYPSLSLSSLCISTGFMKMKTLWKILRKQQSSSEMLAQPLEMFMLLLFMIEEVKVSGCICTYEFWFVFFSTIRLVRSLFKKDNEYFPLLAFFSICCN